MTSPQPPLSPLTMAILLALAERSLHGYALMREIEEQSNGRLTPGTGSLYAALDRLVDEGHIREGGEEVVDGRNRRTWCLTESGRDTAATEVRRMLDVVDSARSRRLIAPDEGLTPARGR